jgi:demethylmenaquinone methyltransferase/2-methoxy-6-polyprenyl-1,4-benzoquinol methylase
MAPRKNQHLLDLAGGTGDIGLSYLKRGGGKVTIADLNFKMLSIGKNKEISNKFDERISWLACNGEVLPFNNNNFDMVSISFGLRNVAEKSLALNEIFRVLKPGGRFMCLEFSKVTSPILDNLYQLWSANIIPKLGEKISGQKNNYEYLVESIKRFPNQDELASLIRSSKFNFVKFRNLSGGIAAIHSGWKL